MPIATFMPVPKQHYDSFIGNPLVGGKLYTFAAGTSTPMATYSDSDATTPQQNPIVLNVRGEPDQAIFWYGNYRVELRDSLGNLVYSVDNFNTDPFGVVDKIAELFSSSGASIVGWIQSGIGAVRRTVQEKLREVFSFRDFGAVGSGLNETILLQKAASERGGTGRGQEELTLPPGDYLVDAETTMPAITINADTLVRGAGGQLRSTMQDFYMLWSSAKGNIRYEGMRLIADATSNTNDAQAAIYAEPGNAICLDLSVTNTSFIDTSWGALFRSDAGTGLMANLRYIGNSVISSTTGTKSDGLHMVGRNYNMVWSGNTVIGRGDAAIAVNMVASHQGANFSVTGNALFDNAIGVDVSGGQYGVVSGNACYSMFAYTTSNPAIRLINYTGSPPRYVVVNGNLAISNHTANSENDIKVDAPGFDTHISLSANMLKRMYLNSRYVSASGNHFLDGGTIFVENNSGELFIGQNTFEGAFDIFGHGNAGLAGNVYVSKQNWTRQNHLNFLPGYSSANPFWALNWFFEADTRLITNVPFSSTAVAASPADVANGVFVLDRPCIVDAIIGLADLATHSGHVIITTMAGVELVRADFNTSPGAGATNAVCVLAGPTLSGNVYKAKLMPGTYKLRIFSDLNTSTMTLKSLSIAMWG